MTLYFNQLIGKSSRTVLITEGLTLLTLGLGLTTTYWINDTNSTPSSSIMGALFIFLAICIGIITAIMLFINMLKNRIDLGTIIAILPFLGFAIWGIWYSYTDPTWSHNLPTYWGLLGVIIIFWLYIITKFIKQKHW